MSRMAATAVLVCTLGLLAPLAQSGRGVVTSVTIEPQLVRTADPIKRGLKLTDFPRTLAVTDNVYTYEDFHAGDEKFTTTNMFVVKGGVPVDQAIKQANWGE